MDENILVTREIDELDEGLRQEGERNKHVYPLSGC